MTVPDLQIRRGRLGFPSLGLGESSGDPQLKVPLHSGYAPASRTCNSPGLDAGRRRRQYGLLLAVLVAAAGVQDSTAGRTLLEQAAADHPTGREVWVDGGCASTSSSMPSLSASTSESSHTPVGPGDSQLR